MTPSELYQAGKLDEAVAASLELVKQKPADTSKRFQLAEFACIAGDLERADRQFETISNQDADAAVYTALIRQLIRAETTRRECFQSGRVPEFIGQPSEKIQNHLRALVAIREGDLPAAADWIDKATEETGEKRRTWTVNGEAVSEIRDLDDVLAPILEVHTSTGKYFWVAWEQIVSLELHPPKRTIDMLWRGASLSIEAGPDGEVYLPAIYPESGPAEQVEASFRLGRSTDWESHATGLVRGHGLKMLLAGERDLSWMQIVSIESQEQES